MSQEKLTIEQLERFLEDSAYRLQSLPERDAVDSDTDRLFDALAKEHHHMFSYIIDYLTQNQ
ncbi:hypothetical protein [Blautia marasmi]|uniref:hypothetical protein n=1 Tax=Blautia marasmi TaxID=1917868 RepID=UPI0035199833